MKFKVGDKVRIREELKVENVYDCFRFTGGMRQYKNKIATITNLYNPDGDLCYFYDLDIDNNRFCWTDEMLKPVQEDVIEYKNKIYDVYKEIDCDNNKFNKVLQLKEVKEEILDEKEKEYLNNVIKYVIEPTHNEVDTIAKCHVEKENYIRIKCKDGEIFPLLNFRNKRMYKGMESNEPYTLEQLGLEE